MADGIAGGFAAMMAAKRAGGKKKPMPMHKMAGGKMMKDKDMPKKKGKSGSARKMGRPTGGGLESFDNY